MSRLRSGAMLATLALGVAILAPLLAGEAPLLVRVENEICSPALDSYGARFWPSCPRRDPIDWRDRRRMKDASILWDPPVPYGPEATDLEQALRPPGVPHYLGTDSLGRDILSRIIHGFPVALMVGGAATLFSLILGLVVGSVAGLAPRMNLVLTRLMDLVASFPTLILALALAAAAAKPGVGSLIAAIALTGWTGIARFFRAEILRQKGLAYFEAARAAGAGSLRLAITHLLPNALAPILVTAAFSVSQAILMESGMSFLGVGVPPGTASWGGILSEAQRLVSPAWWLVLFPSLALFLTVLACNLMAEGLRESNDPRLSRLG